MKMTLKLVGLSCSACEIKIERTLSKLEGVTSVDVSYVTSVLTISYDEKKQTINRITNEIERLGYHVVEETETIQTENHSNIKLPEKSDHEKHQYRVFLIAGLLLLGAYFVITSTTGFDFIPKITSNMGYGILFTVGLLSSIHCIAMCGGLNLSLCVSYQSTVDTGKKYSKYWPSFLYNLGRVLSYTIIGGIVGAFGSLFRLSNTGSAMISAVAGAFMIIMGLNMLHVFPWLRKLNPHIPKVFTRKIEQGKKNKGPFIVGLLNGLMPCGPLQAMQLYALGTGSFLAGALSMLVFSLGTVPLMFAFGALGSFLSSKATKNMLKVSALLVILLGFIMLNRAYAFTGMNMGQNPSLASNNNKEDVGAVSSDVQKITTQLVAAQYPPLTVQAGIPVEWTIIADENNLNGCNGVIIIPEYDIKQELIIGENLIQFTPTESGTFGYSCWMGMIRSSITVLEKVETQEEKITTFEETSEATGDSEALKSQSPVDNTGLPACCQSPSF